LHYFSNEVVLCCFLWKTTNINENFNEDNDNNNNKNKRQSSFIYSFIYFIKFIIMATLTTNLRDVVSGHPVIIISGKYKGLSGHFVRWPFAAPYRPRKSAWIHLDFMDNENDSVCLRLPSLRFGTGDDNINDNNDNNDSNSPDFVTSTPRISITKNVVTKEEMDETLRLIAVTFQQLKLSIDSVNERLQKIEDLAGVANDGGKMQVN
jgi:hypothetical protein